MSLDWYTSKCVKHGLARPSSYCSLAGTELYSLLTEAHTCEQFFRESLRKVDGWKLNLQGCVLFISSPVPQTTSA